MPEGSVLPQRAVQPGVHRREPPRPRVPRVLDGAHHAPRLRKVEAGYFTDQRWIDAVPVFFEHEVVRDLGCNVAYWNLHERTLAVDESGAWTAGGVALRFFHFSGHDADDPLDVSSHVGPRPEWWRTRSRRSDACSSSGRSG